MKYENNFTLFERTQDFYKGCYFSCSISDLWITTWKMQSRRMINCWVWPSCVYEVHNLGFCERYNGEDWSLTWLYKISYKQFGDLHTSNLSSLDIKYSPLYSSMTPVWRFDMKFMFYLFPAHFLSLIGQNMNTLLESYH